MGMKGLCLVVMFPLLGWAGSVYNCAFLMAKSPHFGDICYVIVSSKLRFSVFLERVMDALPFPNILHGFCVRLGDLR